LRREIVTEPTSITTARTPPTFDPTRFERFRFLGWTFDRNRLELTHRYSLDDEVEFVEVMRFPGADPPSGARMSPALERMLDLLHLVTGVSYYKTAVPEVISIETGTVLDTETASFLRDVYVYGLSEFAWVNQIDLRQRVVFPSADLSPLEPNPVRLPRRTAVPLGGGKDSLVTVEALRAASEPVVLFSVGNPRPIEATAKVAGLPHVVVERELSANISRLNELGAYNGHVPITAVISVLASVAGLLYGWDVVAMSNERSASAGNLDWDGLDVNHQWSKGLAFESGFREQLARRVSGLEYFSFLRPFSELAIARAFATLDQYHDVFTSCNTVFRRDPARRGAGWCGDCPKCRFVFLSLAPFMSPAQLERIFGRNLLDDGDQVEGYMQLVGRGHHKPFECVGEEEESLAAFRLLSDAPEWREARVVREIATRADPWSGDHAAVLRASSEHHLPDRYEKFARAFLRA
jgi:hypothetical protein